MTSETLTPDTTATDKPKRAPTVVTTVTMADGRSVDFNGEKRKMQKDSFVDGDGKVAVRIDFVNGKTILFPIPDSLLTKFAAHGAEQKLGDAAAGCKDVDDMVDSVQRVVDQLSTGNWKAASEGGESLAGTSVLARAIVAQRASIGKPIELDKVKEFLKTKTQKEKLAMRANAQIKPFIEEIEAAKNTGVDSDALLDTLA